MNINPWGNHQEVVNGHVVGASEQAAIYGVVNTFDLDAYITRYWFSDPAHLKPPVDDCGCGFPPIFYRIENIEFRHENKANFIPTNGVPQAALAMGNRGLVDFAKPTFDTSIFPGGDALQAQMYEALNGYWLAGQVP